MSKFALSITKEDDFAAWYQEVVKRADLADNSGVRGCMIIKPWGYAIWERIQNILDKKIKDCGHENCYFPIFIPLDLFKKEAEHVSGFAKEMAIVTHHRLEEEDGELVLAGKLETPLVIRPTSETIIGESFAKWISSYRDLPVKINQWANVVRWEMRPRVFLRTSEFLWQEGHTAHATHEEALDETLDIIELYRSVVEDAMQIPVTVGKKSPSERFPGAVETYCIEAMMQDGKALQAGTSHYLGQNFSKAANIQYQDNSGQMTYAHTTSWGVSTRLVGGLIMTHSDNNGLQLPPQIAPQQIVILPFIKGTEKDQVVLEACEELKIKLESQTFQGEAVRVRINSQTGTSSGNKWDWIRKGVPIICELGPRDLDENKVALVFRHKIHDKKLFINIDEFVDKAVEQLREFETYLLNRANNYHSENIRSDITNFEDFKQYFNNTNSGFVKAKWCEEDDSEKILDPLGVTIRCIPTEQSGTEGICVLTGKPATTDAVFAKAY